MSPVAPLFPYLSRLPIGRHHDGGAWPIEELSVPAGTLFLAHPDLPSPALVAQALALGDGRKAQRRRLAHDARGAPVLHPKGATTLSLAGAPGVRALLLGRGPIGIDAETLPRVARDASPTDDWLAPAEHALLAGLPASDAVVELACRWVLREAYGKALGRGLDLPLDRLAFTLRERRIVLPDVGGDWRCTLHRRDDLILGMAASPSGQTGSALRPATRSRPSAGTRPRPSSIA